MPRTTRAACPGIPRRIHLPDYQCDRIRIASRRRTRGSHCRSTTRRLSGSTTCRQFCTTRRRFGILCRTRVVPHQRYCCTTAATGCRSLAIRDCVHRHARTPDSSRSAASHGLCTSCDINGSRRVRPGAHRGAGGTDYRTAATYRQWFAIRGTRDRARRLACTPDRGRTTTHRFHRPPIDDGRDLARRRGRTRIGSKAIARQRARTSNASRATFFCRREIRRGRSDMRHHSELAGVRIATHLWCSGPRSRNLTADRAFVSRCRTQCEPR